MNRVYLRQFEPARRGYVYLLMGVLLGNFCLGWVPGAMAAEETRSSAKQLALEAYRITKTAGEEDVDAFNRVIELCEKCVQSEDAEKETIAYANRLLSWAYNRRGEVLAKQDKDQEAFAEFDRAVKLDPDRWRAWHNRGVSQAITGKFAAALEDFNRTLELEKGYPNAWFNRGEVLFEMGKLSDALQDYNRAIELNATDPEFLSSRGHTYLRLGELSQALADLDRALELDPKLIDTLVLRGNTKFQQGSYPEAAEDFRQAIKQSPEHLQALLSLSWMMSTCPADKFLQPKLAVQAAEKARKLQGDKVDPRLADVLAAAHAAQGNFPAAVTTLEAVIDKFPEASQAAAKARLALYQSGKPYRSPPPRGAAGSAQARST